MHIYALVFATVLPVILHGDGFTSSSIGVMVDGNDLSTVFGGKHSFMLRLYVDALVHLLSASVHRVLSHTERRGDKHKLISP